MHEHASAHARHSSSVALVGVTKGYLGDWSSRPSNDKQDSMGLKTGAEPRDSSLLLQRTSALSQNWQRQ